LAASNWVAVCNAPSDVKGLLAIVINWAADCYPCISEFKLLYTVLWVSSGF
jgi:hypothetical protein